MNKTATLWLLLIMTSINLMAQEGREKKNDKDKKVLAPKMVTDAFKKEFPDVPKVSWSKEDENEFEAEFKLNGKETSATYDYSGHRKELETEIEANELPTGILGFISKNHPDHKITEMAKIVNDKNEVMYEVEVSKGGKSKDVLFDEKGNRIGTNH